MNTLAECLGTLLLAFHTAHPDPIEVPDIPSVQSTVLAMAECVTAYAECPEDVDPRICSATDTAFAFTARVRGILRAVARQVPRCRNPRHDEKPLQGAELRPL